MSIKKLSKIGAASLLAISIFAISACSTTNNETETKDKEKPKTNSSVVEDKATNDKYTTDSVVDITKIDTSKLGLVTPGTISVGTLSDAPPNIYLDENNEFTGYDNEILKAIAKKLDLKIEFASTEFSALLAQVANKKFDVGSSNIATTAARRETVGFTNGYDFGYMAIVAPNNSSVKGFDDVKSTTRIAVVQATVQDDYAVNTLGVDPVRFPDYNTAYAALKSGQVDAWVAPSNQAEALIKPEDKNSIVEKSINTQNFNAYAVNKDNKALIDALNAGLDAVIADGTWEKLNKEYYPDREIPSDWKPGSKSSTLAN